MKRPVRKTDEVDEYLKMAREELKLDFLEEVETEHTEYTESLREEAKQISKRLKKA